MPSASTGAWEDYLLREMLPEIEQRFGCGGAGRRGVFGKSSGGFGAMVHAMRHGGTTWAAAACHSGDMGFELGGPILKDKLWFYVGVALPPSQVCLRCSF